MTHRCERCGVKFPDGSHASKKYCMPCAQAENTDGRRETYQIIRADLIKGRRCQICNGPIPERKFRGSKFCSRKCEKSLDNPVQRLKVEKICPHCKRHFHPIRMKQVYCSHKCAGRAAARAGRNLPPRLHPPKDHGNCQVCGTSFIKKERGTKYCSRACWYRSRRLLTAARFDTLADPPRDWANCRVCGNRFAKSHKAAKYCGRSCYYDACNTGMLEQRRRPRIKLTASRFDRFLDRQRYKRPRVRLTAQRFDKMVAVME